eukprot:evm.model.scf_425EXC.4 EVM.evm.TU.scf_425EXC.4   scf_425EXC:20661-22954(+)
MDKGELDLSVLDAGGRGYLDFLHDEVLALEGGSVSGGGSQAADADGAGGGVKRERDADESESEEGQEASASGKAGRPDGRAGRSKACREKARRERINERFQELAKLCDPEDPKTDKASILAEGIKIITQLKVEAGQLRQLNKFLEERVGNHEKEKGQSLYQQSLMLQGQFQQAMQPPQQPAMPCPLNTIPQGGYQVAIGLPASGMPSTSTMGAVNPMAPCPGVSEGVPQASTQPEVSAALGTPAPGFVQPGVAMPNVPNYAGPMSWMPFMDTSQDHLLRPPAA